MFENERQNSPYSSLEHVPVYEPTGSPLPQKDSKNAVGQGQQTASSSSEKSTEGAQASENEKEVQTAVKADKVVHIEVVKRKERRRSCISKESKAKCAAFLRKHLTLILYVLLALLLGWFLLHRGFWPTLLYVILISLAVYLAKLKQAHPQAIKIKERIKYFYAKVINLFKKG